MINIPIEIGDVILTGKFKNHKVTVKEIGTDEHGLPTVNGKGIMKIRVEKLMQKNVKENITEAANDPRIEKLVNGLNALIKSAIDSDGDPIPVVDKSGTWEEPYIYSPIEYRNGQLKITSRSQYKNKPEVDIVLKRNMEFDGIPQLRDIMRQYKAAIKKSKSSKPIEEIDGRNDFLKFSVKNSKPEAVQRIIDYLKTTTIRYSLDPKTETLSLQYHKADRDLQGMIVGEFGHHITESKMKIKETLKLSRKESTAIKNTLRKRMSEGIDNRSIDVKIKKENDTYWFFLQHDNDEEENITNVGMETIELARHAARMKGFNIVGDKDDKQEDSFNKLPDTATPPKPAKRETTKGTEKPKEIDLGKEKTIKLEEMVKVIIREEIERFLEKKNPLSEATKISKKVEAALRELKDLQDILAKANAEIEVIKKKYDLGSVQKKADELLKVQLWDFLEELKKDNTRIVQLKDIILRINQQQASPATYEYEKVLDFVMTQVNQEVKAKILAELKIHEKIGQRKANVSFTTEASGGIWDSIISFLGKFVPALKKKGESIDNGIAKAEAQLANIE